MREEYVKGNTAGINPIGPCLRGYQDVETALSSTLHSKFNQQLEIVMSEIKVSTPLITFIWI